MEFILIVTTETMQIKFVAQLVINNNNARQTEHCMKVCFLEYYIMVNLPVCYNLVNVSEAIACSFYCLTRLPLKEKGKVVSHLFGGIPKFIYKNTLV